MSELKMREALELADAALRGSNMNMNVVERKVKEALDQPSSTAELSDEEIMSRHMKLFGGTYVERHEFELIRFARAVIAADRKLRGEF